jgi:hypothetical protein
VHPSENLALHKNGCSRKQVYLVRTYKFSFLKSWGSLGEGYGETCRIEDAKLMESEVNPYP